MGHLPSINEIFYHEFALLKGFLNRIDYAASGHYPVESNPRMFLEENVLESWHKSNPTAKWNSLQNWTGQHKDESIVVIGQTGLGKTESALRWLSNDKGFFLLPLKSAINSIYNRLSENYGIDSQHLAILHSDTMAFLLEKNDQDFSEIERQINESRALAKQLTIATLDQIFNFVYH